MSQISCGEAPRSQQGARILCFPTGSAWRSHKIPGFFYIEDVVSQDEKDGIIQALDTLQWKPLTASKNSRLVQHYGFLYDYSTYNIRNVAEEIPSVLIPYRDKLIKVCEELHLNCGGAFNQCIVNNYLPGQGIGRHTDVRSYGPVIGCFTVGGGATVRFTYDGETYDVYVKPNSLYIMSGPARYAATHEIDARMSDVVEGKRIPRQRRISITFRHVPCK